MQKRAIHPLTSPSANVMMALQLAHNGSGGVMLVPDTNAMLNSACAYEHVEPTAVLQKLSLETDDDKVRQWRAMNEATQSAASPTSSTMASPTRDTEDEDYDAHVTFSPIRAASPSRKVQSFDDFIRHTSPTSPARTNIMDTDDGLPDVTLQSPHCDDDDDDGDEALRESNSQAVTNLRAVIECDIDTEEIDAETVQEFGIREFGSHLNAKPTKLPSELIRPYDPEQPAIDKVVHDAYDPTRPGYARTVHPMRTADLEKLRQTLIPKEADDDIGDLFGTGVAPKVRMY
jgi:hypothetical protein